MKKQFMKKLNILLFFIIFLLHCSTPNVYIDYLENHPNLIYDEALKIFGTPSNLTSDSTNFIATWDKRDFKTMTAYMGKYKGQDVISTKAKTSGSSFPEHNKIPIKLIDIKGEKIIITFDKSNNKMINWQVCRDC